MLPLWQSPEVLLLEHASHDTAAGRAPLPDEQWLCATETDSR
jgi:hypothetical protein